MIKRLSGEFNWNQLETLAGAKQPLFDRRPIRRAFQNLVHHFELINQYSQWKTLEWVSIRPQKFYFYNFEICFNLKKNMFSTEMFRWRNIIGVTSLSFLFLKLKLFFSKISKIKMRSYKIYFLLVSKVRLVLKNIDKKWIAKQEI